VPRAAQIERDMGGNPQVAYALARAYRADKRFDDAARLLETVIENLSDHDVYEELAEMYKQQGNADKWDRDLPTSISPRPKTSAWSTRA